MRPGSLTPPQERRQQRSDELSTALQLLLESFRQRRKLQAVAVADHTGILVAGAGVAGLCEEMAARAPLGPPGGLARSVALRRLQVRGQSMILCGAAEHPLSDADLGEAALGIGRILAA